MGCLAWKRDRLTLIYVLLSGTGIYFSIGYERSISLCTAILGKKSELGKISPLAINGQGSGTDQLKLLVEYEVREPNVLDFSLCEHSCTGVSASNSDQHRVSNSIEYSSRTYLDHVFMPSVHCVTLMLFQLPISIPLTLRN
jgi:hypothetical protein